MVYCSNCGNELYNAARFCNGCGKAVNENLSEQASSQTDVRNNERFTILDGYISYWKNYVYFGGRARRTEYWGAGLFNFLLLIVFIWLDETLFGVEMESDDLGPLFVSLMFATIIPSLSVAWRRLQDIGKSGANVLWSLTIIGIIPVIIWCCQDSKAGVNKYGPNPKGI